MHHVKSTILIALMLTSLALSRGITSRAAEDEDNDDNNSNNEVDDQEQRMESDVELTANPSVIALTPSSSCSGSTTECALAANAPMDRTSGNTDQARLPSARAIIDKMDGNKRLNIGRRVNLDKIRNGLMHASSYPGGSIWQILDNLDSMRLNEIRESLASIIPSLIDPLMPPQMQYVDNTLRLMAIKNWIDDLLAKIFPNLHMIQHPTEQNNSN